MPRAPRQLLGRLLKIIGGIAKRLTMDLNLQVTLYKPEGVWQREDGEDGRPKKALAYSSPRLDPSAGSDTEGERCNDAEHGKRQADATLAIVRCRWEDSGSK